MEKYRFIKQVVVENLHGQFDVDISLEPGLNIVYGKNGRGKTTLLHIIANAAEQDFNRFQHLLFRRILLVSGSNETLELVKNDGDSHPSIIFNGAMTSYSEARPELSEAEADAIKSAFGSRSMYLPAFRSVLERSNRRARNTIDGSESEFEHIVENEMRWMRSESQAPVFAYELRERAANTALKTTTCRQWFGMFVPVVRYPSIADVEEGLSEEWNSAQNAINRNEQRMFEETFLRIFRSIAGIEKIAVQQETASILESIENAITEGEDSTVGQSRDALFSQLVAVMQAGNLQTESNNALLEIYNQALLARNSKRRELMSSSREFEKSVNLFLDNKELKIGAMTNRNLGLSRGAVSITSGKTDNLNLSALSSGERQIVTMLYSASRGNAASGPFLIDEPELSLHVDWQRIILREIGKQSPGRQIIACTHSPEVGADHIPDTQDFEPTMSTRNQADFFGALEG